MVQAALDDVRLDTKIAHTGCHGPAEVVWRPFTPCEQQACSPRLSILERVSADPVADRPGDGLVRQGILGISAGQEVGAGADLLESVELLRRESRQVNGVADAVLRVLLGYDPEPLLLVYIRPPSLVQFSDASPCGEE